MHYPTHRIFDTLSVSPGHCRCLPQPHKTCINGVSVMLCLLAKTMCGRTQLTMPRADPGGRGPHPSPMEITNSIGLYRICNWTPPPEKSWTPWKCWTVLLHRILESYSLMIVFFRKKAMITGIPLQNQLRTYKNEEKNNVRAIFQSVGLGPPPPPQNPTKISWIRAWIYVIVVGEKRYRS